MMLAIALCDIYRTTFDRAVSRVMIGCGQEQSFWAIRNRTAYGKLLVSCRSTSMTSVSVKPARSSAFVLPPCFPGCGDASRATVAANGAPILVQETPGLELGRDRNDTRPSSAGQVTGAMSDGYFRTNVLGRTSRHRPRAV
jgi:hypothetical protein